MQANRIIGTAVAATLGLASMAHANLIAYDGFHTGVTTGSGVFTLTDADTSGWAGQWIITNNGTTTTDGTVTANLTYPGVSSAGNAGAIAAGDIDWRQLNSPITDTAGHSVFVSFLIQNSAATTKDVLALVTSAGFNPTLSPSNVNAGIVAEAGQVANGGSHWGLDTGLSSFTATNSTHSTSAATTTLLVVELDYQATTGHDTVELFVNPTSPTPPTPDVSETVTDAGAIDGIKLFTSTASPGGTGIFDEISVGTAFADVVPSAVPEPASLGLIASAAGMLLIRRRRSSRAR